VKKRFSEEQIIRILQEVEAGLGVKEVSRKHGICEQTYYRWKSKYGGMDVSDAKRLKALEEENRKLKRIVADQLLDIVALKDVCSKKW
jgi:putative transposase